MQTIAYAKNNLPQLVHQVEAGEPLVLSRRGKPVAVLQSYAAYQQIQNTYLKPSATPDWWDTVGAWRAQMSLSVEGLSDDELAAARAQDVVAVPAWVKDLLSEDTKNNVAP